MKNPKEIFNILYMQQRGEVDGDKLDKLWKEKGLQPCIYCNALTPHFTCPRCGRLEDEALNKI